MLKKLAYWMPYVIAVLCLIEGILGYFIGAETVAWFLAFGGWINAAMLNNQR